MEAFKLTKKDVADLHWAIALAIAATNGMVDMNMIVQRLDNMRDSDVDYQVTPIKKEKDGG